LFNTRQGLEAFIGILFRDARAIAFVFFGVVFTAWASGQILKPTYSATALIMVDPQADGLLNALGSAAPVKAPDTGIVDGAVEIMRSEPIYRRAMELAEPAEASDLLWGFDLNQGFLDFFRVEPKVLGDSDSDRALTLRLLRQAVTVNRRGLTPVIAVTARAGSGAFAAEWANAVAEAHIALQLAAKIRVAEDARDLVASEYSAVQQGAVALDLQADTLLRMITDGVAGADNAPGLEAELSERQVRIGQRRAPLILGNLAGQVRPDILAQFYSIEQSADEAKDQASALRRRVSALDAEVALQRPDIRLIAPASVPSEPVSPDMKTIMSVATLLAAALALASAFTLDGLAHGLRSTAELAEAAGVPTAIGVPRLATIRLDGMSHADQVIQAPISPFSESMRTLRVAVQRSWPADARGRIVVVTSANEGDGKTTIALGLARAFEATGQRVLLIDADVRSAALHRHIDVPLAGSFEDVLAGRVAPTRVANMLRQDPLSRLWVLVNATRSDAAAEVLFGGSGFSSVLRGARASFDTIVVDMPAMGWSAEASYILPVADAAVVVASWGKTMREQVHDMLIALRQANPAPIPVVPALSLQPATIRWPARRYEPGYSAA